MGQLRGCTPLDGSACLLQCCWTNEKHWGPAEEQMPSWISPSAVAVSHLLFCLPASLFLVGKESLMPSEEGEHILWPIIFGETLIDPPCGIRLVWYCQRASHSIKDRISLLRFPPVTGMGVGKHLVWVAIMLSFQSWGLKSTCLPLTTFQSFHLALSCFIPGVQSCAWSEEQGNMSLHHFCWARSLCLLYFNYVFPFKFLMTFNTFDLILICAHPQLLRLKTS